MSKKIYGQDLKKKHEKLSIDLKNTTALIRKRFFLVVGDYSKYLSKEHEDFCINNTLHNLPINRMLEIIIQTEANYVEQTSEQLDIFN